MKNNKNLLHQFGFTLVELLVAITIFAILVAGFYMAFWVGIRAHLNEETQTRSFQNARLVLNKFAAEFQNALYTSQLGLGGKATEVYFYTQFEQNALPTRVQYKEIRGGKGNKLVRETYDWKAIQPEMKELKPESVQEMAYPIESAQFLYFKEVEESDSDSDFLSAFSSKKEEKEYEWVEEWKAKDGFPLGIRVTLKYKDITFTRMIPTLLKFEEDKGEEVENVQTLEERSSR